MPTKQRRSDSKQCYGIQLEPARTQLVTMSFDEILDLKAVYFP